MKIKKALCFLLCLTMLIGMLAGCGNQESPKLENGTPLGESTLAEAPSAVPSDMDKEIELAISYGIVPEELQGDYDQPITFRQYTEMLTSLIALWDDEKLAEWESICAAAASSDEEMHREDGILEMAYALVLMGHTEPADFTDGEVDPVMEALDAQGRPSWNYPLFPTWEDDVFSWSNSNYMWGGIQMCGIHQSLVSGLAIYPFEPNGDEGYLQMPLTRGDAIRAVLRFGETDPAVFEADAVYLSADTVETYDKTIITDELLRAPSDLPEVSQDALPSQWKGTGLSANKDGRHVMRDYSESDIILLSENGFNFVRLFLGFSTLRFPDYPDDISLVNENELKDLDWLLAWCIQHGVHLQISMIDTPNGEESFDIDQAEWDNVCAYWSMLARRYADIPAKFLSFDFVNEIEPSENFYRTASANIQQIFANIKEANPQRAVLYSYQGSPTMEWVEKMAELGFAIGCHPYYPNYITTSDYIYAEQNPYAEPSWPQLWLPRMKFNCGQSPLVLQGAVSGAVISLHVTSVNEKGGGLAAYADGKEVASWFIQDVQPEELFTFTVPEGTETVEIWVTDQGDHYAEADTLIIEAAGEQTVLVCHDVCDLPDWSEPLPIVIQENGTVSNSADRWIDADAIYDYKIAPMKEIADRYGVGFMVNEMGIFSVNVYWDIEIVAQYHDDMIAMLEEQDLPWVYCELYNHVPKYIATMHEDPAQWEGSTMEEQVYGGKTYNICKELLDVFRKYTLK